MAGDPKYISIVEAALRWGVGKTTIYELIHAKGLRAIKVGARTLIEVRSGDDFFAALPSIGQAAKR
jgi:excisionase family DNA binding protein